MFAAKRAVISEGSYAGKTSTTSNPMKFKSFNPLINFKVSPLVKPPISGVPVPGAYAGSTKSISKVRKTLDSPTLFLIRSIKESKPISLISSVVTTSNPNDFGISRCSEE